MNLRPYQNECLDAILRQFAQGHRKVMLQAETGAGKTVIASEIMRRATAKEKNVLFLAHSRELVHQCSDKLTRFGVDHTILMRGEPHLEYATVQVASMQSLWSWVNRRTIGTPLADLIIPDEAHRSASPTWQAILGWYPEAYVLGLSATPGRNDGKGLGDFYETLVPAVSRTRLIDEGWLVPTKVYAPSIPDLRNVKSHQVDYVQESLEETMNTSTLIGDLWSHWKRLAHDRQTIVFATGVKHSMCIANRFNTNGVKAVHIDGGTPTKERDAAFRQFESGDIQVISNCNVVVEGVDLPVASCIVLARPTKSLIRWRQMVGRGCRPHPHKSDCLLIDHSGSVWEHGMPDDDIEWSLEPGVKVQDRAEEFRGENKVPEPITCPKCKATFRFAGGTGCPMCGHQFRPKAVDVPHLRGKLKPVGKATSQAQRLRSAKQADLQKAWDEYVGICIYRGWKINRAAGMYKDRFGCWPNNKIKKKPKGKPQWAMVARDWWNEFVACEV